MLPAEVHVPKFYPRLESGEEWGSELKVRRALGSLDDDWHVFHSVTWQSKRGGREADGEADFVLLHPARGVIVLEVKGGRVDVVSGRWSSTDRNGQCHSIKNPFEQAKDSKYALLRFLRSRDSGLGDVPICHGVVFTDGSVGDAIGAYGPREIILDRADLADPAKSLARLGDHWNQSTSIDHSVIRQIVRALAPTTSIKSRLRDRIATANDAILELTGQQKRFLAATRRLRRCIVQGGAGTGKTVLAVERVRMLEKDGFRPLLLCFNAPLASVLARELEDTCATVATFHSFAMTALRAAQRPPPKSLNSDWWETTVATELADVAGQKGCPSFDALVIDEGQDFAEDWLAALMILLSNPDDGPVYIFTDSHQQLYGRRTRFPEAWPVLLLDINCRNTLPIAEKVSAVFGETPISLGAEGQLPIFVETSRLEEQLSVVEQMVYRMLTDEQLKPEQIVVLSDSKDAVMRLRDRVAGDESFVGLEGRGIVAETVHRFKGLESDVVILVLTESNPEMLTSLAYVGLSRARAVLAVVGRSRLRRKLGWVT